MNTCSPLLVLMYLLMLGCLCSGAPVAYVASLDAEGSLVEVVGLTSALSSFSRSTTLCGERAAERMRQSRPTSLLLLG